MNAPAPSPQAIGNIGRSQTADARAQGRRLVVARALWVAVVVLVLGLYVVNIPAYYASLHVLATRIDPQAAQLTPEGLRALQALGLSVDAYAIYHILLNTAYLLSFLAVGAVLFLRKADDRLAMLTSFTLVMFPFGDVYQALAVPTAEVLAIRSIGFVSGCCMSLIFYLFPNGHFVPRWTRWLMLGWIINQGLSYYAGIAVGSLPTSSPLADVLTANGVFFLVLLASVAAAQIYRYRRVSTRSERQQTKWVVFGLTVTVTGMISVILFVIIFPTVAPPGTLLYFVLNTTLYLGQLFIPLSLGIAILRYRLWDIDVIINRTLVYGALTASVIGVYVLVVGYLGTLFRVGGNLFISLLATGLVAVLFQPLRERLQRAVNHFLYGQRDEPYTVITRLSQRLEEALVPDDVLPSIVATVAQTLKLPYATILLKRDDAFALTASYGKPAGDLLKLPLVYQSETIGQLCLSQRAPGEAFTPADKRLLDELARHAGLAAHAIRLTTDLQSARERLVTTREEERRRLRRDLHDGLGSALTGVTFKLDAADTLLDQDPARARALLAEARAQTQSSISDIRRLVYNLRPPILDEWGLIPALREHLAQYELKNVRVSFEAPDSSPALSAAIEVAVYYIVLESLTNVIKHAQATACTIRLSESANMFAIEIEDNGVGRSANSPPGVGITTMRERATELGGSCVLEDVIPHGTRVCTRFPL